MIDRRFIPAMIGKSVLLMGNRLSLAVFVLGLPCFALNVAQIQSTYEAILNASADARPSKKDVAAVVNEASIEQLSDSELKSILPVIGRCLNSARPSVVQRALRFCFSRLPFDGIAHPCLPLTFPILKNSQVIEIVFSGPKHFTYCLR
jgi:hypothetical protein